MDAIRLLRADLAGRCPPESIDVAARWLKRRPLAPEDAIFYQYRDFPSPDPTQPEGELEVATLQGTCLWVLRVSGESTTEFMVPLRSIDRFRIVEKPDKTTVDLNHGECTTWLEQKPGPVVGSDLLAFAALFEARLAKS